MDTFTPTLLVTILIATMGRSALFAAVRSLNWWVWTEDLPVPRRRLVSLLVAAECLLPLFVAGIGHAIAGLLASLGWTNPASSEPAVILVALLATLPAYGLFLSIALRTTILRGIAVQAVVLAQVVIGWGLMAALTAGLSYLTNGLRAQS